MALVLMPEAPLAEWLGSLDAQIGRSPSFFDGRPVIIDLAQLPPDEPALPGLMDELRGRRIHVIGIEGVEPGWDPIAAWNWPPIMSGGRYTGEIEPPDEGGGRRTAPAEPSPHPPSSLLLGHSVRSGQSVVHQEGDVIVVGSVASGAEIVAGGSIHVYGALRGRAIAGLLGNPQARIFCRRLEAELLAIDGLYRTADDMEQALHGRPVQAWLDGDAMIVAALD